MGSLVFPCPILYNREARPLSAASFFRMEANHHVRPIHPCHPAPPAEGRLPALAPFPVYLSAKCTVWAGDPISKSAYEVLPVYSLLTARYGIALAFLLLVFGRRIWRGLKVCSPRDWLFPSLCMGGAYVANNIALELTAATSVAFLRSLSTVMTPFWPWLSTAASLEKNTFRFSCWSLWGSTCSAAWAGCPGLVWEKSFLFSPLFCWPGPDFWRARPGPGGPRHPHHPPDRRLSPHGPAVRPGL